MSDLAQTHIDLIDESVTPSVGQTEVPLYFIATRENKIIDSSTNKIAPGTAKSVANQLMVFNSSKSVMDSFGTPYFEEENGTINQGSELNEWGLFGLYNILGITNTAYVVRADIDLGQLEYANSAPRALAKNGTQWFDLSQSSLGFFRANGNSRPALAWDSVNVSIIDSTGVDDSNKPLANMGQYGDIAMVAVSADVDYVTYENFGGVWYEIGSPEWVAQFPSYAVAGNTSLPADGNSMTINGTEITFTTSDITSLETVIAKINSSFADGSVLASNDNSKLKITKIQGTLTLTDGTGTPLKNMGFAVDSSLGTFAINQVQLFHSSHTNYPSGAVAGSIWVKTTQPNNGSNYVVKNYKSSTNTWTAVSCPLYASFLDAEASYGNNLQSGSLFALYNMQNTDTKILTYQGNSSFAVTGDAQNPTVTSNDIISITTLINGSKVKTNINLGDSKTVAEVASKINKAAILGVTAEVAEDNKNLRIISLNGKALDLENVVGESLTSLGITAGEYSNWVRSDAIPSITEPTSDPADGTLWINSNFAVDIMVNDGVSWKGYNNLLGNEDCDPNGVILSSEEPLKQTDGTPLVENDLWINTADMENYPALYRYFNGSWELVDKTDQTTPFGIVFADARSNAGPEYTGSSHTAFSTKNSDLVKSDYVDPDCVDPRVYASGTLLFNMRYSTYNVKKYEANYFANAIAEYGETFKVGGNDTTPSFPTPGTVDNPIVSRWVIASGNATDGAGLFGRFAQRKMIVNAINESINFNEDIRSNIYDYIIASAPGYPEVDSALISLNADKKDLFYIISDTPKRLEPNGNAVIEWANNANNAASNGENGRTVTSYLLTRQYPPMALTSNVDGSEIAVPTSIVKIRNWLQTPRGQITAGTAYGPVTNASTVGYITEEDEYSPIALKDGLAGIITQNKMNPIMYVGTYGLLFWAENTENSIDSSLSDEHTVRTVLHLKRDVNNASYPYFFKIHTEALRNDFYNTITGILSEYVSRGEIYDFTVVCDRTNNTNERIQRKELWCDIAIEATKGVEQIYIPIRIVNVGTLSGE